MRQSDRQMKVIGITGGVGSGKSQVLQYLQEAYGAVVCQMDEVARMLQKKETDCFRRIRETFGRGIVGPDGELDRQALAGQVFSSPEKLRALNAIVHPEVLRKIREDIVRREKEGTKIFVVESALLPDVGSELCGEIWYIYAPEKIRRERLKASRGYTDEKITGMMASQPSEEAFRRISTAVIDNGRDFESTKRQIGELL